jgi:hypothetical protein
VLTAAVVGLGIAGVSTVNTGIGQLATTIQEDLDAATMTGLGTLGQAQE